MTADSVKCLSVSTNLCNNNMRGLISDAREIAKLCRELAEAREARQNAEDDLMRTEIEMQLEIDKAEAEVAFWKSKAYEAEEQEGKREMEVEKLKELVKWYENRHSTIIST